jgi:hypothetical protein
MTWTELLQYYHTNHPDIIKHVLPKTWSFCKIQFQ